jgi:hypothetical protein
MLSPPAKYLGATRTDVADGGMVSPPSPAPWRRESRSVLHDTLCMSR